MPSQNLFSISSHLCCGRPRVRPGRDVKLLCHSPLGSHKTAKLGQFFEQATCAANRNFRLNDESDHVHTGTTSKAERTLQFILVMVPCQSFPSTATQQTTARSIQRCTTFNLWICDATNGNEAKPNKAAGEMIASKYFNRNFKETYLFVKIFLCLRNLRPRNRQSMCKCNYNRLGVVATSSGEDDVRSFTHCAQSAV